MDVRSNGFVVHAINERKKVVFKGEVKTKKGGRQGLMGRWGRER